MNKFERLQIDLNTVGTGSMKCFGNSMLPLIKSGSKITFIKQDDYEVGDIVFCKVSGWYIDAHIITKKDNKKGWMIANYDGWENGWTKTIYGKAVQTEYNNIIKDL